MKLKAGQLFAVFVIVAFLIFVCMNKFQGAAGH